MLDAGRDGNREQAPAATGWGAAIALAAALSLAACATPTGAPAPASAAAPVQGSPEPRPVPPASLACPSPPFPEELRRTSVSGLTRVSGEVLPDGSVRSVVVIRSSGSTPAHKQLDRAAADALASCRFPPAPGTAPATTTVNYRWTAK